ncbi:MAG: ferredoxin [Candidatus Omnitrophica bacterium]|nr:ferredoxin [Candidatus Omnitrophota bacterium]
MVRKYEDIKKDMLKNAAEFMCASARTAPKAKGQDNLQIIILDKKDIKKVRAEMTKIGKATNAGGMKRDALNIKNADHVVLIGTKKNPIGLNCGFCGCATCRELEKKSGVCAYNSLDLGIALGSAAAIASNFHIDNRLMYSIGKAAINCGILSKKVVMAIGIPLSATGKNPFFDRQ